MAGTKQFACSLSNPKEIQKSTILVLHSRRKRPAGWFLEEFVTFVNFSLTFGLTGLKTGLYWLSECGAMSQG